MPSFSFRTKTGEKSCTSDACELADAYAAWSEMTKVCSNLIGDAVRKLERDSDWQIELVDPSKKPIFRIRLVAETLVECQSRRSTGAKLQKAAPLG
jgi:Domain of unknown function (DUF6894)